MSATLTNGRSRKSLAEQIDRLDSVLDGLADGLNEAVAEAVKQAVRAVLTEVLTNPELLAQLHPARETEPPAEEAGSASPLLSRTWGRALLLVAEQVNVCRMRVGQVCRSARDRLANVVQKVRARSVRFLLAGGRVLLRARWIMGPMLAAAVLASLTGVAAYHLGPWMAAGGSGAGGLGTALGTPVSSSWLRRIWPWRAPAEQPVRWNVAALVATNNGNEGCFFHRRNSKELPRPLRIIPWMAGLADERPHRFHFVKSFGHCSLRGSVWAGGQGILMNSVAMSFHIRSHRCSSRHARKTPTSAILSPGLIWTRTFARIAGGLALPAAWM